MATAAAKRYARAIFELAQAEGHVADWTRRVRLVAALALDPEVAAALENPTIAAARRMELVDSASGLDREATNLAKLLIESTRVHEAPGIEQEFERLADQAAGRVTAMVTTAVPIQPADRDRMAMELSKGLGQAVTVEVNVDPKVIGGLKVQYGDRVIDATVATRLQQLRRRLTSYA